MRPLEGLSPAGRAAWREAQATLTAIGEDPELSRGAVARYATAVDGWRALEAEWRSLGSPGTTLGGATGIVVAAHPLVGQIAAARREAAKMGEALGLDPQSRRRLSRRAGAGRPPGAASAPDRAAAPRRTLRSVK